MNILQRDFTVVANTMIGLSHPCLFCIIVYDGHFLLIQVKDLNSIFDMQPQKSLRQIVEEGEDVRLIFTHDEILPAIKNQDSVLNAIFTPENVQTLISYLNREHPLDPNNHLLSYKLPYNALEIMTCECHLLTNILFTHQYEEGKFFIDYLLDFLEYQEHYLLAGYFSKVMIAISKRVFSPEHKFNEMFCQRVFENGGLKRCLNHIYSASTNQLIMRWMTLKGKNNDFVVQKKQFLFQAVKIINGEENNLKTLNFTDMSLESLISLILLMLKSSLQPPPTQPQPVQHKNLNLMLSNANQKQLYSFICQRQMLAEILKPVPNPTIYKIKLVRNMIQKFRIQNQQLQLKAQPYKGQHLSQQITFQMFAECLEWANQHVLDLVNKFWNEEEKKFQKDFPKVNLLNTLDLVYELHLLPQLTDTLSFYYEQKQSEHVEGIVKLLQLKNNIVQNSITKIMMIVLKKLKCPDFARTLLHQGISTLIDEEGIREHILGWAKVILESKAEQGHVYENPIEEAQWDHMTEVIENAEQIQIGNFRFCPNKIPVFYSASKAKQAYFKFLNDPITIQYQPKQNEAPKLRKNISSPPSFPQTTKKQSQKQKVSQKVIQKITESQNELETVEITNIQWERTGYLSFSLDQLMNDL